MPQPSKLMSYQKMRRKIGAYSGSFTTKLRNSLIKRNNISTGELINSIKSRLNVLSDSKKMITSFEVSFKGYGGFLNKNIHPKRMPSIDAIVKWMKDRNIKPYRTKSGRFASREQAAYRIARGIQKNGFSNFMPLVLPQTYSLSYNHITGLKPVILGKFTIPLAPEVMSTITHEIC